MRKYQREIALSIAGLAATLIGFAASLLWGWRALAASMLVMAAWLFAVRHASYLVPGFKADYLEGKAAGAIALASAAIGLLVLGYAKELAAWSHRACHGLPLAACAAAPVCANGDVVAVLSPTRSIRAVRFTRTCDSEPPSSTHVSILAMGEPVGDAPGNVYIVDGKADLTLLWIDGRHLAISGGGAASPRLQQSQVSGVRVSYEERRR